MPTAAVQRHSTSLFEIEQSLLALLDTADMVSDEQQAEYVQAVESDLATAVSKRQKVGEFFLYLKDRANGYQSEIKRLQAGLKAIQKAQERVSNSAVYAILSVGEDEKGKLRKLHGHNLTLSAEKNPARVDITDADAVPDNFKTFAANFPMTGWRALVDLVKNHSLEGIVDPDTARLILLTVEQAAATGETSISRSAIKEALDAGKVVPGAQMSPPSYRLAVR